MDQLKTGKFIAECRKKKNLTQAQLAEKLLVITSLRPLYKNDETSHNPQTPDIKTKNVASSLERATCPFFRESSIRFPVGCSVFS